MIFLKKGEENCTGSWENYFRPVGKINITLSLKVGKSKRKNIDHRGIHVLKKATSFYAVIQRFEVH